MAKFNTTKKGTIPTEVNKMGEKAYKIEDKALLASTVLTSFLNSSYYETETEIVNRIKELCNTVDPLFVAKLAVYARQDANMRSSTHLLASEIAHKVSGTEWGKRFYEKVVARPDDISEILSAYKHFYGKKSPITAAMKKGFRNKLQSFDAYQLDKYKMKNKDISMVDLFNLFHPMPKNQKMETVYKAMMSGKSIDSFYDSKILEKELTKAGQKAKAESTDVVALKEEAFEAVLDNISGMPIMNLVRNLVNIIQTVPHKVDEAVEQLTNKHKILNSRLLPFRFASAYTEVEKLNKPATSRGGVVKFEKDDNSTLVEKVLKGLEKAIEISCQNIKVLDGNVAVLVDHSGSVRGDAGNASKVSAFSKTTTAMIGNLFGSMLSYKQDNVYFGLFGDRLINVPMDRTKGMLEFNANSFKQGVECGGGTENGLYIFLSDCIKNKTKVDNLVIFSDMVIGSGGKGGWDRSSDSYRFGTFQELFKKFKQINPHCFTVAVNIKQTGNNSVFDKSLNVLNVSGWSDSIFDLIQKHSIGYETLVKEIEAIEI